MCTSTDYRLGWTVRGSNYVGAKLFSPVQTGPGAHEASIYRYWSFPRIKLSGHGMESRDIALLSIGAFRVPTRVTLQDVVANL